MTKRNQPSRAIDKPEPGFFRLRRVKGGPFVAGRITRMFGQLYAEVNGAPASVEDVWTSGEQIDVSTWAVLDASRPLDPFQPVDRRLSKPAF